MKHTPPIRTTWRKVFLGENFWCRFVAADSELPGNDLMSFSETVFTSLSAKHVDGDGDRADDIENNGRTKKISLGIRIKKRVAQMIKLGLSGMSPQ
jgi:hypothetical protein